MGSTSVRLSVGERDGERRYAKELWKLATVRLSYAEVSVDYGHFKVWREGLEVAIKIKGSLSLAAGGVGEARASQYTAISLASDVHANHNEALNSSIRRRSPCLSPPPESLCKNSSGFTQSDRGTTVDSQLDQTPLGFGQGNHPSHGNGMSVNVQLRWRNS